MTSIPSPRRDVGAMTAAMRAVGAAGHETWLRVGVVRDGAIVEERWLVPGRSLTWGRSEHADVVIAGAPVERADLIRASPHGWELVLAGVTKGRLANGGSTIDVAAQARAGAHTLVIDDGARLRIDHGGVIVLVERRARPPARPAARLPSSLGAALGIDERFTAIAVGSLMLHAAFLLVAGEADWPAPRSPLEMIRAEVLYPEPTMPDPPAPDADDSLADADAPEVEGAPDPSPSVDRAAPATQRGPSRPPSAEEVASVREEALRDVDVLIGGIGAGGALGDLLRDGPALARAEDVMGTVQAGLVADLGPRADRGPDVRSGDGRGLAELDACEGCGFATTRDVGPRAEGRAPPRERPVRIAAPPPDEIEQTGDLPGDPLAAEIRRRMRGVQTCYEHALIDEPDLSGRLVLEMRVEEIGTMSRVRVGRGSIGSAAFHACVVRTMSSMRLREGPTGGAVDVSFPFVFSSQR